MKIKLFMELLKRKFVRVRPAAARVVDSSSDRLDTSLFWSRIRKFWLRIRIRAAKKLSSGFGFSLKILISLKSVVIKHRIHLNVLTLFLDLILIGSGVMEQIRILSSRGSQPGSTSLKA